MVTPYFISPFVALSLSAKILNNAETAKPFLEMTAILSPLFTVNVTNHLDLESITALNNGLMKYQGTCLFTSHDHTFTQTIANRIIEITPKGMLDKMMTYDEYLTDAKVKEQRAELYGELV